MEEVQESTGMEVANTLGQMTQGELQEVADNAPLELLRLLLQRTQTKNMKKKVGLQQQEV